MWSVAEWSGLRPFLPIPAGFCAAIRLCELALKPALLKNKKGRSGTERNGTPAPPVDTPDKSTDWAGWHAGIELGQAERLPQRGTQHTRCPSSYNNPSLQRNLLRCVTEYGDKTYALPTSVGDPNKILRMRVSTLASLCGVRRVVRN